jgi:hypothetical protein
MIEDKSNGMEVGTVGWVNDGGNAYSLGGADNDGISLVNVTLYRGKDPTVKLQAGVGQGQQLLCQIAQGLISMPTYGARVLVSMCGPNPTIPGHPVVLAELGNSGWKAQGNMGPGDLVIPAPSGPGRLILSGSGSCSFITAASDGSSISASLGPDGAHIAGPWGSIKFDDYGLMGSIGGGPSFKFYNIGGLPPPFDVIMGSIAQISAGTVKADGLQVLLGPDSAATAFVPTAAYNDGVNAPAPSPLFASLLSGFAPLLESLQAIVTTLAGNPAFTGVTPLQVAALIDAVTYMTSAVTSSATVLTTTTVKVAYPLG